MVYDLYGNLTSLTQCSSHYAYNCGTRAVPTDLDTNEFKVFNRNILNYDTNGRYLISKSNALFTEQHLSNYNALGLPQTQTNAQGVSQYLSYDEFGRVYFTASDDGSYAQKQLGQCYSNCPINAVTYLSITSPNTPDTITYFDLAGREVAKRTKNLTGQWIQSRAEYDARGQKTKIVLPHILNSSTVYQSNFYYDNLGRKWRERAPDTTTRTMSWAGLTTTTSVNSYHSSTYSSSSVIQQTSKTNNGFGQLILSQDAHNYNTRYEHDALGALTKATNIDGSITAITYDNYGRKISMSDPDKGHIQFKYNGVGTVVKRISPNNDQTLSFYDAAARLIRKETHSPSGDHTGLFNYSGVFLDSETSSEGIIKQHAYDALGRLTSTSYQIDGNTWNTSNTYDHLGRLFQSFDASGNGRGTQYTYQNGYMSSLREAQNSTQIYYQPTAMDAWGNITQWTLANGATGSASYDNKTGFLKSLFSTNGAVSIQNNIFEYDGLGNLRARVDKNGDNYSSELVEVFNYDLLNRLKTVDFQGVRTLNLTYYSNGGIKSKSDIASNAQYVYGQQASQCSITAGAHALSSIGSKYKYCYDNKGNQISAYENSTKTRDITFTGYDKPSYIESTLSKTWFFYDNQYKRFKRIDNENTGKSKTTYYIGNTEIVNKNDGINEIKRYIGEYVIDTIRSNGTRDTYYLAKDHIGSIVTMMNTTGGFSEKLSYDAFGKRRNGTSWNAIQQPFTDITIANGLTVTEKGFTGHEHVDHANIIHMGGRIYDPSTGRFAQADPIVQAPENGQSLNRYSYVFNNPLSYTDPTGYFAETDCGGAATGGNATCRTTETNDKSETDKTRAKLVAEKWKQRQAGNNKNARAISKKIKDHDSKVSAGAFSESGTNQSGGFLDSVSGYVKGLGQSFLDSQAQALAGGIGIEDTESIQSSVQIPISESELGGEELAQSSVNNAGMVSSSVMMIANLRNGEFTPSKNIIQGSLSLLVKDGAIDASLLSTYVPDGLRNSFMPTDRVPAGQKFRFKIGDTKVSIKWHSPDLGLRKTMPRSNSARVWTAQIQVGKKFLMSNGSWTRKQKSNRTHIPVIR